MKTITPIEKKKHYFLMQAGSNVYLRLYVEFHNLDTYHVYDFQGTKWLEVQDHFSLPTGMWHATKVTEDEVKGLLELWEVYENQSL